ncbi:MAG TPA: hydroxymethylglutaryl-CoA reductase (NADPH) [Candidatus Bathyarchaeia archaeon]|nr:hydroxymethylglutaryl-CoA reductase (NADPH) [Candidatus Bathyarchaeia archaeon]
MTDLNLINFQLARQRRNWLERKLKVNLRNIGRFSLDEKKIKNHNCENLVGAVQVPLGIAGPIKIKNKREKIKEFFLPLATTEGALVASVNRGCKATRLSGGINVLVEEVGTTRGPVFRTKSIGKSLEFTRWLEKNFAQLQEEVSKTSNHLTLKKLETNFCGRNVYVRFYFKTQEAMGMNMVTMATEKLIKFIKARTDVDCLSISGNFCIDKKPSWLNFISGRGKRVWAEAKIKKQVVAEVLKTDSEKLVEVVNKKCLLGSIMAGSLGFNAHFANIIAAIFLATGQDMAHVAEGSLGITTAEMEKNGDLFFSVYIPDLMVGTIGGGTSLGTQKEALSILGLDKGKIGDALKLSGIVGGAVLAGELSLLAALSSGHLAKAHQKLGRGL